MFRYIRNANQQDSKRGSDYEVHNTFLCNYLPNVDNQIILGQFNNCYDAVAYAKKSSPVLSEDINGCYWCCSSCHTD